MTANCFLPTLQVSVKSRGGETMAIDNTTIGVLLLILAGLCVAVFISWTNTREARKHTDDFPATETAENLAGSPSFIPGNTPALPNRAHRH